MAIKRVEINDYLAFKGTFAADFCPGVNVIIGGNGTGKTTLLKAACYGGAIIEYEKNLPSGQGKIDFNPKRVHRVRLDGIDVCLDVPEVFRYAYIPEKDIFEHAKGLLTFIEQKQTDFDDIYKRVLIAAQDVPTQEQSEIQKELGQKISDIIGGHVEWVPDEGRFYTIKANGNRIPFANEASGFKKLGFLGLLIACGQLEPGAVLFWDEPENSLNPELVPELVDILLKLSRKDVQIIIATHSEILADYFDVYRQDGDEVMFTSLYKDGDIIKASTGDRFDLLTPNKLTEEPVKLYEKKLDRGLGGE